MGASFSTVAHLRQVYTSDKLELMIDKIQSNMHFIKIDIH